MSVYNQNLSDTPLASVNKDTVADNITVQAEPFYFNAVLYPQRSLGKFGIAVILGIFITHALIFGGYFLLQGAWPIPGFFGLELILVIWLFLHHHKAGRNYESICLTENELIVQNHSPWNRHETSGPSWVFEPAWVKVFTDKDQTDTRQLKVVSHGRGVIIGEFLTDDEKMDLADALNRALAKWRADLPFRD